MQDNRSLFSADGALRAAGRFWFVVAVSGQLMFVYYILALYGRATVDGNLATWGTVMPKGYVVGDGLGNLLLMSHVLLAAVITLGGAIQLIPQVRMIAPTFHRWNGRVYVATAVFMSLGGFYLVWVRGGVGSFVHHLGVSANGLAILICAALALRAAMARRFDSHRRWALRLFLVVSGVWFFRVGLMLWLFVNKGPVGFDPKTFEGPFLNVLAFAEFLLPLAVLEMYLRAQDRGGNMRRLVVAGGLTVLTLAMGVGIGIATMGMWLPRIR